MSKRIDKSWQNRRKKILKIKKSKKIFHSRKKEILFYLKVKYKKQKLLRKWFSFGFEVGLKNIQIANKHTVINY
ncbi:hypothetical protein BpHYR1_011526 [Brachionus plicatilis]|uniref:Uncharacterized protein n=1 Tax=Brachionus plicatilis TaxID=10195 RepID=A0A3M7QZ16_BRAPC|nr:hypothetical protein BpHYR1_011526 [Brachionus plicatilis]